MAHESHKERLYHYLLAIVATPIDHAFLLMRILKLPGRDCQMIYIAVLVFTTMYEEECLQKTTEPGRFTSIMLTSLIIVHLHFETQNITCCMVIMKQTNSLN